MPGSFCLRRLLLFALGGTDTVLCLPWEVPAMADNYAGALLPLWDIDSVWMPLGT